MTRSRSTTVRTTLNMLTAVVVALLGCAVNTPSARAEAFGEIGKLGKFGKGPGEFYWPIDLAVDPEEANTVFVVDDPEGADPRSGEPISGVDDLRVQKFEATLGGPKAEAEIPVPEEPVLGVGPQYVTNIAVDSTLHRLYVLKGISTGLGREQNQWVATEIEVYSTQTLKKERTFYIFPETKPGTGSGGVLRNPHGLSVEPGTHNLVVLGENVNGNTVIQRITATGPSLETGKLEPGEELDDTSEKITVDEDTATGIAAGTSGTIYVGGKYIYNEKQGWSPGVVKLETAPPNSLSNPKVTDIHLAAENEPTELTGGASFSGTNQRSLGEQLAISPDSGFVYAPAVTEPEHEEVEEGSYEVRGFSTATGAQQLVYGGRKVSEKTSECHIQSDQFAIAAGSGGVVYILDEGWELGPNEPYPYGFHLIEFGPGGHGCPEPTTSLTVDGNSETNATVNIEKGAKVTLNASNNELHGAEPQELTWEIAGPEPYTKTVNAGCPSACLALTEHRLLTPGEYTVTLNMVVDNSGFGSPPPVSRKIKVTAPPPRASFEISDSSPNVNEPKPGEKVTFNAEASLDLAGKCSQTLGCEATHELEYMWNFGDGSEIVTTKENEQVVSHVFANPHTYAAEDTVVLTVINKEGVASESSLPLVIQGTPQPITESIKEVVVVPPPIEKKSAVSPPPVEKRLTTAQKLARALKECKKLKAKKKRATCESQARHKYEPKRKKKRKK